MNDRLIDSQHRIVLDGRMLTTASFPRPPDGQTCLQPNAIWMHPIGNPLYILIPIALLAV